MQGSQWSGKTWKTKKNQGKTWKSQGVFNKKLESKKNVREF